MWWLVVGAACTSPPADTGQVPSPHERPRWTPPDPTTTTTTTTTTATTPTEGTWIPPGYFPTGVQKLVVIGDSITVGTGLADPADRWASLLVDQCATCWPYPDGDLTDRFGPIDVLDLSEPGMTAFELVDEHLTRIEDAWGTPVEGGVLMVGTLGLGDVIFTLATPTGEEIFVRNLERIDAFLSDPAVFPDGAWWYLPNIYDPTDGEAVYPDCYESADLTTLFTAIDHANAASRALAVDAGFAWVDIRAHFLGHGHNFEHQENPEYDEADPTIWFNDCLHPNERGHHELRRLFLGAVDGTPVGE